jgi:hypothetical protein
MDLSTPLFHVPDLHDPVFVATMHFTRTYLVIFPKLTAAVSTFQDQHEKSLPQRCGRLNLSEESISFIFVQS